MIVVRSRRGRLARACYALAFGCSALLPGCGGSSNPGPGTPVVTLGDSSGDFVSYRVGIDSITLTGSDNVVVTPLLSAQSVDLARLTDISELIEVPAVRSGSYKSATLTLDYTAPSIWVNVNGQAVRAQALDGSGKGLLTQTVTVTFDPNRPVTITRGASTRMAIDIDLTAMNSIDTSASTPKVTVRPFLMITPAPTDATVMRARGLLVLVQSSAGNFVMNVRPLTDQVSALGALTVDTDTQTYFNINGVAYTGAAGLTAMAGLQENTLIAAFGTLGSLAGITPGFHATSVYVGTSLESPLADHIIGIVSARSGSTLTVHGATLQGRLGLNNFVNNAAVTLATTTVVSEDGVARSGLTAGDISVGQQIDVSGQAAVDASGNVSLNAALGQVRLAPTRLWATLNTATSGSASLDVLSFGGFIPGAFNFTGTGPAGQDAMAQAYDVDTGSIDVSAIPAGTLLQVDGIVSPFGAAPPDFTASAVTAGTATEQRLEVEWINGGATAPFIAQSAAGLTVDLSSADLGAIHHIRTGPMPIPTAGATLDLKTLGSSPLITTVGADQSKLLLAVGGMSLTTGVSVFNSIGGFTSALGATFPAHKIFRLVAVGQYNSATNTFVATRISVALAS
jgi:hypothetical protein